MAGPDSIKKLDGVGATGWSPLPNTRLAAAKADADKKMHQKAIAATDRKIDALVYELYSLTAEEIKIVEST